MSFQSTKPVTLQAETQILNIDTKGPFEKNGREFDAHTVSTPLGDFTQYSGVDEGISAEAGDEVEIFYTETTSKFGTKRKIIRINKLKQSSPKLKTSVKQLTADMLPPSKLENQSILTSGLSSPAAKGYQEFSNKNARVGGLMHDATNILIHNASIEGIKIELKDVILTTKELLRLLEKEIG